MSTRIVIHRGPIPGTDYGHHWFTAGDGRRYGIESTPHHGNDGWGYVIVDDVGDEHDDSMFRFREIREWAVSLSH